MTPTLPARCADPAAGSGRSSAGARAVRLGVVLFVLAWRFAVPSPSLAELAAEASSCKPRLANLSTRGWVGGGEHALIGGFIVAEAEVELVLRALGPSLAPRGVDTALADPSLEVYRGDERLAGLDDGLLGPADWGAGLAPDDRREPAIALRLPPGEYTAVVRGRAPGVGLVELFQTGGAGRLANLSTRAWVGAGEALPIGGLIVKGGPQIVALRALGPALRARGVARPLADPRLELYREGLRIGGNASWERFGSIDFAATQLRETGLAPGDAREAALLLRLDPGAYTVVLRGEDGGEGVALFEAFALADEQVAGGRVTDAGQPVLQAGEAIPLDLELGLDPELARSSIHREGLLPLPGGRLLVYRSACEPGMAPAPDGPVSCRTRLRLVEARPDAPFQPLAESLDRERALVDALVEPAGRRAYLLYQRVVADADARAGFRKDYQLVVWDLALLGAAIEGGDPGAAEVTTAPLGWTDPTGPLRRPGMVLAGEQLWVLQEGGVHVYRLQAARIPEWLETLVPEARSLAARGDSVAILDEQAIRLYRPSADGSPEVLGERAVSPWSVALAFHGSTLVVASAEGLDCPGAPFGGDICTPVEAALVAYGLPLDPRAGPHLLLPGHRVGSPERLLPLGERILWGDTLIDPAASGSEGQAAVVGRLRAFDPRGLVGREGLALLGDFTVAGAGEDLVGLGSGEAGFGLHRFRVGACREP